MTAHDFPDWRAAHDRLEQITTTLSQAYVDENFAFDHGSARIALDYCLRRADGSMIEYDDPDMLCPGERHIIDFLRRHGQSLDWVFTGDLRSMIASCAAHRPCAPRGRPALVLVEERKSEHY